jgi:hypothetical protein
MPAPVTTTLTSTGRRRGVLAFLGTAAATGILFHLILLAFDAVPRNDLAIAPSIKGWWHGDGASPPEPPSHTSGSGDEDHAGLPSHVCPAGNQSLTVSSSYIRPGLGQYVIADEDEWTMDRIRKMVEGTKGYYVRDYSLGLGWNNVSFMHSDIVLIYSLVGLQMRYIVETSLLHAQLLNRTLVLPSFIYARACEWNM